MFVIDKKVTAAAKGLNIKVFFLNKYGRSRVCLSTGKLHTTSVLYAALVSKSIISSVAANLFVPSVYVGVSPKLLSFSGLYAWALDRLIPGSLVLHPPL